MHAGANRRWSPLPSPLPKGEGAKKSPLSPIVGERVRERGPQ